MLRGKYGRMIAIGLCGLCLCLVLLVGYPNSTVHAQAPARLTLLQSDANRIVLELELANYSAREQRVNGTLYSILTIPDFGSTGEQGKPQIPIKGTFVGIPPGAQPTLKILADESRSDTLAHPPIPVPTKRVSTDPVTGRPRDLGDAIIPDTATYSANRNYPAQVARIASVGDWRSQHFAVVEFHPLQYNPATRRLLFHRRVRVEITLNYPRGMSPQAIGGALNEGPFEDVLRKSLINYNSAKNWRAKSAPSLSTRRSSVRAAAGPWYKVAVNADGIHQITCAQLRDLGVDVASPVTKTLQIFKQGTELGINVAGNTWSTCSSGDYIEFFGQAANTKYTNTNIYWLTYDPTGAVTGKRVARRDGSGAGSAPAPFTDTIHIEQNLIYVPAYPPGVEGLEHWYWNYVSQAYGMLSRDYPVQIDYLATGSYSATLQVDFIGLNSGNHHTLVYVNGNLISDTVWSGSVERQATITFPQSYLVAGANTIRVSEPNDVDSSDAIFANYFNLSYMRPFTATGDVLRFNQAASGTWQYQITGFTNSTIEAFDITDQFNVAWITPTITPGSPYSTLQFTDASAPPRAYYALTATQRKTPTITLDTASNWRNPNNGADYIIISHGDFIPSVQPLATWRDTQLPRVQVVDVQDIYDEFNDGLIDPQAIRDFLAYAYGNWQAPAPWFVLLVGDGTYDPKGYCATPGVCSFTTTNATLIPPYLRMVDPWYGETASDNRLVAFGDGSGDTLPDMAIGRLPANNATEASAMVSKILNYEQNPPAGFWRSTISFVADSKYTASGAIDGAGDFWASSDELYTNPLYAPASLTKERIYYNRCPSCPAPPYPTYTPASTARAAILSAINAGRLIVNYVGHGGHLVWSSDSIFSTTDLSELTNGGATPVMLEMTCLTGFFHSPSSSLTSLAETHVRAAGKGTVASWAATGLGLDAGHSYLNKGFLNAVMNQGIAELGTAASYGKSYLIANAGGYVDLVDTYTLFGDPASRLQVQFLNNHFFLPYVQRQ